jgi:tetraacyldisaccharide 4'-kinase
MKPPGFWSKPAGLRATLLSPLGALYAAGTARRLERGKPAKLSVPVISVGNINVGGTGKTPTVMALVERLGARGLQPHVVSRGYGGTEKGPHRVSSDDAAERVGDEPLLLSAFCPVWVAQDRAAGGKAAVAAGADVVLLDDAHQNPALAKDLSLVVVDALQGFGNRHVLPAGPLREPIVKGLARTDHLILIGEESARQRFIYSTPEITALPRSEGTLAPLQTGMPWAGMRVLAFAGIGHPEKMFRTLETLGVALARTRSFDDHASYSPAVLQRLEQEAHALGAQLVTTEKDAVRLPPAFLRKVLTLPVRLQFDGKETLDAALDRLWG